MKRFSRAAFAFLAVLAAATPALAVQPDEILKDQALEHRAREISGGLRCLVCQNQSIDDSDAPLAKDLRVLVRERLQAGDTDEQVRDYVVARYGEFVLLKPPLSMHTLLLWLTPLIILAAAVALARTTMRRPQTSAARAPTEAPLSPEEQARLEALLKD